MVEGVPATGRAEAASSEATLEDDTTSYTTRGDGEPEPSTVIGRYIVLSRLGAGAMGVVIAAYDPQLDRKVALKLLKPHCGTQETAGVRLQREAQALARLNHENVVAVHDVGTHRGRVFVAMEFVRGQTLGRWMQGRQRSWREVVSVFCAAGRGLAAAHEVGLIHRDFKPDNVMLGEDGRTRVMDFGLARSEEAAPNTTDSKTLERSGSSSLDMALTRTGALMGTPAYMAPEQLLRQPATARTDQFSFCVAMHEALYGARPFGGESLGALGYSVLQEEVPAPPRNARVPAWLHKIVLRGLAKDPDTRFESMSDLLAALDGAEARRRRNRVLTGAGAVGIAATAIIGHGRYEHARRIDACEARGASIDEVWNAESRQALQDGILGAKVSYAPAVAQKVVPWVDEYAAALREATTAACMHASVEDRWDDEQLDRAQWCLDERRLELATFVTQMAEADSDAVERAVQTAAKLPPIGPCVDHSALAVMPDPPEAGVRPRISAVRETIAEASYLVSSGAYDRGLEVARVARERAEPLDWPPLIATAHLIEGLALMRTGAYTESEAAYLAAFTTAGRAGSWGTAATAASRLVHVVGYAQARHDEAKTWAELSSLAIAHATDPLGLREAARCSSLGNLYESRGEYEHAKALHHRALVIEEEALGSAHPDIASTLGNLGNTHFRLGEHQQAKALHERALVIEEEALGPTHPRVATALTNLGNVYIALGELEESKALFERALAVKEEALGPDHPHVATSLANLGSVHQSLGELAEARTYLERALVIQEMALGPDHPNVAMNLSNLAAVLRGAGELEDAKVRLERALTILRDELGSDHAYVAWPSGELGNVLADLGYYDAALEHLERAVTIRSASEVAPSLLASSRFDLARALWDAPTGLDHARARTLAEQARDGYAQVGRGQEHKLSQVVTWLAERSHDRAARTDGLERAP